MGINKLSTLALLFAGTLSAAGFVAHAAQGSGTMQQAGAPRVDRRKLTKIQTASTDYGDQKGAVEVRYLDLPWGATTFGYIETGLDARNGGYYSGRTWPIAHLRLTVPAVYDGKELAPGDYAFIITPRNAKTNTDMTLALAAFKPEAEGGTFLKAGDVFVETPKDARIVSSKTIKFTKGEEVVDQLHISVARQGRDVDIKLHYGDRALTERLKLK